MIEIDLDPVGKNDEFHSNTIGLMNFFTKRSSCEEILKFKKKTLIRNSFHKVLHSHARTLISESTTLTLHYSQLSFSGSCRPTSWMESLPGQIGGFPVYVRPGR